MQLLLIRLLFRLTKTTRQHYAGFTLVNSVASHSFAILSGHVPVTLFAIQPLATTQKQFWRDTVAQCEPSINIPCMSIIYWTRIIQIDNCQQYFRRNELKHTYLVQHTGPIPVRQTKTKSISLLLNTWSRKLHHWRFQRYKIGNAISTPEIQP